MNRGPHEQIDRDVEGEPPLEESVVDQAIFWFVLQASGHMTATDEDALRDWLESNGEHARAWARLKGAVSEFGKNRTLSEKVATRAAILIMAFGLS